jgi:hypothetical protein
MIDMELDILSQTAMDFKLAPPTVRGTRTRWAATILSLLLACTLSDGLGLHPELTSAALALAGAGATR